MKKMFAPAGSGKSKKFIRCHSLKLQCKIAQILLKPCRYSSVQKTAEFSILKNLQCQFPAPALVLTLLWIFKPQRSQEPPSHKVSFSLIPIKIIIVISVRERAGAWDFKLSLDEEA